MANTFIFYSNVAKTIPFSAGTIIESKMVGKVFYYFFYNEILINSMRLACLWLMQLKGLNQTTVLRLTTQLRNKLCLFKTKDFISKLKV